MDTGLLRSADRPAGWPLAELLKAIRLELEERIVGARMTGDPAAAARLQIAGLLLQAEGIERARAAVLKVVSERAVTGPRA